MDPEKGVAMKRTITAHVLLATAGLALTLVGCAQNGGDDRVQGTAPDSAAATSETAPASESAPPTSTEANVQSREASTSEGEPRAAAEQPPPDPDFCTSAELSLSLGEGGGAAGTVYRPLRFTNAGDFPCVLQGFPGVSYVAGDDGHQVGKPAEHTGGEGPALTLYPGDVAHADVGFVQVRNYDAQACSPTEVRGLRVYPPQETASKFVEVPGTGCARSELHGNQLTVSTIEEGPGHG